RRGSVAVGDLGRRHRRRDLLVTEGGADGAEVRSDPLDDLRTELETEVDQLPVNARLARFEHANDVLARELAQLDEV
ncbi:MAG: hypothetical protein WEB09_12065, partial [Nitriliruptor sp.]